tara:strand:+ start:2833 stop:3315 length:483 start_codon:yes stop_codon:yes gene_type:complete
MSYKPIPPDLYYGNQVIINSDRLLFNAKNDSIFLFSKEAIGFSANGSINFDTSNKKEGDTASKFIVNSPNIYLGLDSKGNIPTEPALLGNLTEKWLNDILEMIEGLIDDLTMKVSYISTYAGTPTAPNPTNIRMLSLRKEQINLLKKSIKNIKSKNTKLI